MPALDYVQVHSRSLGIHSELQFFWLTGALSAVLDNAPTYVAFLASAFGLAGLSIDTPADRTQFIAAHNQLLIAISLGAVFFGVSTYIGHGPNLMVKAITEQAGVKTPGFFRYALRYSLPILAPVFIIVSVLFFTRWRVF